MNLTIEEAETILETFNFVEHEGGLSEQAIILVRRIFDEYPALLLKTNNDGRPTYSFLGV